MNLQNTYYAEDSDNKQLVPHAKREMSLNMKAKIKTDEKKITKKYKNFVLLTSYSQLK